MPEGGEGKGLAEVGRQGLNSRHGTRSLTPAYHQTHCHFLRAQAKCGLTQNVSVNDSIIRTWDKETISTVEFPAEEATFCLARVGGRVLETLNS